MCGNLQPRGNMGPRAKRMAKYDKQRIVLWGLHMRIF
jgi:hypothetical protein